jgi:broad specificity polyphosphatase/5'/3'-nucleotidase SurE
MVENIAITNNDKDEQNITKSKITESVEVPPHSHTTQATNATIANANRQEAKTKQKRTKKREWLCGGTSTDSVVLLLVIFCSSLSLFVMAMFSTISCLGSVSS